jgi:hypothetical protein
MLTVGPAVRESNVAVSTPERIQKLKPVVLLPFIHNYWEEAPALLHLSQPAGSAARC